MSRRNRRGRREFAHTELMLAAMVDMLVNILIFLLHLYGTAPIEATTADLDLPDSMATDPVEAAPIVVLTISAVQVDGEPLVSFASQNTSVGSAEGILAYPDGTLENGQLPPLTRWLTARRAAMIEHHPDSKPDTIIVECDRRVPWSVITPVLSTAGAVGFTQFRFIVNTVSDVN